MVDLVTLVEGTGRPGLAFLAERGEAGKGVGACLTAACFAAFSFVATSGKVERSTRLDGWAALPNELRTLPLELAWTTHGLAFLSPEVPLPQGRAALTVFFTARS